MSATALAALFLTLAAVPGVSVLTVGARTASGGLAQGALAALGVAAGDVCHVLAALFGLSALAGLSAPWPAVLHGVAAPLLLAGLAVVMAVRAAGPEIRCPAFQPLSATGTGRGLQWVRATRSGWTIPQGGRP